ncbi:MAG: cytochrome b/b6 domain-containing protein [Polyangiaceae bacterium]
MRLVLLYSLYERIWHWLQAAAIIVLSVTGFAIHAPDRIAIFDFVTTLRIHEITALFTIANGFLSLFAHLVTGAIRQYVPRPRDLLTQGVVLLRYYLGGIFRHEPHPFARRPDQKLNVLQQVTYLAILNVLLPIQVITGVLLWDAGRLENTIARLGGLRPIAVIHVGAAWLFIAFVIMHVDLTTTGGSPLAHLNPCSRAMRKSMKTPIRVNRRARTSVCSSNQRFRQSRRRSNMNEQHDTNRSWNPYLAGIALGIVLFTSFVVTGHGLGASGALARVVTTAVTTAAPSAVDTHAFFATFGGGARKTLSHWLVWEVAWDLDGRLPLWIARGSSTHRARTWTKSEPEISRSFGTPRRIFGGMGNPVVSGLHLGASTLRRRGAGRG